MSASTPLTAAVRIVANMPPERATSRPTLAIERDARRAIRTANGRYARRGLKTFRRTCDEKNEGEAGGKRQRA
jgi:hypothetical protein